ncbi:ABC transporter ATP-binding protein [Mobilitalea sibirica]|uniref:ABC transporter ATP-binding protein n=1 Tax=Mobilitalea sibirica TaxID=1462919 RepID=A0A8J7H7E1_9FIRM|nr:ABC transporter ATP-binding protein [Mobilitalea sibirica]MBH1939380.1 ABC transporter ATP-binding protein [Mobilitalea sibirica]
MRKIIVIINWIARQARPYIKSLFIIFIMSFLLSLCGVGMVIASKELIDFAISGMLNQALISGLFLLGIVLIQVFMKAAVSMLSVRVSETMSNNMRERLFLQLTEVKWTEYNQYHSGDIMTRMTNDIGGIVSGIVEDLPEIITLGSGVCAAFITLLIYDPFLAIFALLLVPVAILLSQFIGKRYMKINIKAKEAESKYRSYLQECIEHMLVLKTFCHEKRSCRRLKELQDEKKRLYLKSNLTSVSAGSMMTGGYWVSYLIVFGWGAMRLAEGTTSFGTFTAFIQLVGQIQQPFMGLAQTLPQMFSMAASAKRVMKFEELSKDDNNNLLDIGIRIRNITFDDVSFEYKEGNPVLRNITTEINQGEIIGLIGASGEGKTTLIHLLMSLYKPNEGSISINHWYKTNISLRSMISYVPQGNTLLSGSISYNLSIGCPDATTDEQITALKEADAWEFVSKLPMGLDTIIGERGHGLSEGQSQRIAIARAFLRKSPILVLDEATSALDVDTEQRVMDSIINLQPRRTCIIITHRPSLLEYCHRIWKINEGKLIEQEKHINEVVASEAI